MQIDVLNQQNVALQSAAEINEQTIRSLEESNSENSTNRRPYCKSK